MTEDVLSRYIEVLMLRGMWCQNPTLSLHKTAVQQVHSSTNNPLTPYFTTL